MGSQTSTLLTYAVRWSSTQELMDLDMPRKGDGSSQSPRRGHSAAYASTDVSPNSVHWVSLYKEH